MFAGRESFIKPITGPTVLHDRVNERIFGIQFPAGHRRFAVLSPATVASTTEMPSLRTALQAASVSVNIARSFIECKGKKMEEGPWKRAQPVR
jgi:hypothetical protein